jgi:hypothetical protein
MTAELVLPLAKRVRGFLLGVEGVEGADACSVLF